MSELRDFYLGLGHNYEQIENKSWYLADLSIEAAIEIDKHLLWGPIWGVGFSAVDELVRILGKYQLEGSENVFSELDFPYLPLWRVSMERETDKRVMDYSLLALKMSLFCYELGDVRDLSTERLRALGSFCAELSGQFSNCSEYPSVGYLVA